MSQQATDHPPLCLPDLPLGEQILIRLDEIIGLLDRLVTVIDVEPLPHRVEVLSISTAGEGAGLDLWEEGETPEP